MKYVLCALFMILLVTPTPADDCNLRPRTVYNTYTPPVYNQQIVLVPKVIEVEVHRDHYYSIDQNYNAANIIRELRLLLAEQKGQPPQSQQQPNPSPQVQPKKEDVVTSQGRGPSPFQKPELVKIVNDSCVKCHTSGSKYPLVTADGKLIDLPEGKANKAFRMVNAGEMPKSSKALDDSSTKLFYDWAIAQEGR